jgi:hypothetical protein
LSDFENGNYLKSSNIKNKQKVLYLGVICWLPLGILCRWLIEDGNWQVGISALKERISTQINITPVSGGRSSMSGPGCTRVGI